MLQSNIKISAEEKVLIDLIKTGDIEARNKLVMKYYPLVVKLTRYYRNKGFNRDDLIQEGVIGLIRACKKFDYNKGVKFTTYACYWIRQSIQMYVLKNSNIVKVPVRKSLEVARIKKSMNQENGFSDCDKQTLMDLDCSEHIIPKLYQLALGTLSLEYLNKQGTALKDFLCEDENEGAYAQLYHKDLKESLQGMLHSLTEQERRILIMRFGLNDGVSTSLRLIGEMYEMSPESVRKIEKRAIKKLKSYEDTIRPVLY